jgi:AAHS family benzoate transporter-like MFS transporter/AAHS family 4-hydroxybenzoate transporter-like MFS transporter
VPINVQEEIDNASLAAFHFRLVAVLSLVLCVDGYDLFNAAYVAPFIRKEWGLGDHQIGLMLSLGIAGLALGAYLQAPVTRLLGRRAATAAGCAVLSCSSLTMALWVSSFNQFAVLRFVLGISLGMLSPIVFAYVNEWAPRAVANRFCTLAFVVPFSLGGIAAGLASLLIAPALGWRGLYLVAVVGLPIGVLCLWFLPESIVTLMDQGRFREVRSYLAKVRPDLAAEYQDRPLVFHAPNSRRFAITALFSNDYRMQTVGIWLASALSLLSLHGLAAWLPSLLILRGEAFTSAFGFGTLLMVMQIAGGILAGIVADRSDRLTAMIWGFAGSAASLLMMNFAIGSAWMFLAVASSGFFIFGTQAVMNNYTAMAYEPALRSTGIGAAVAFSRLGGVIGPLLIGWTRSLSQGLILTFLILAATQVIAAALMFVLRQQGRQ